MFSFSVKYAFEIESSGTITRLYTYICCDEQSDAILSSIPVHYGLHLSSSFLLVFHITLATIEPHTSLYPLTIHYPPPTRGIQRIQHYHTHTYPYLPLVTTHHQIKRPQPRTRI